ncbi:MAG TPA: helicase-related protein, partial [Steroidobacteraceae bacterium]|nr:helicase-related protein [Steroidobacteraceae bacterium]
MPLPDLPVVDVLPQLRDVLKDHTAAVLEAPPGAGKSTIVPLALLGEPWLAGRKLLMLEPRRIAARSIARRMAALLGEEAGQTVGYRTRLDVRVSTTTRIEVVTEGILTRMLQDDPALEDTAAVIFDEFHERSLEADLGLALTLEVRSHLREDLRILVMSATLAADAISALLQNAAIVRAAGRSHPVTIHYRERPAGDPPAGVDRWRMFAAKIADAISESDGDLLAFLPGVPEIHRTSRLLAETDAIRDCDVLLLHGSLSAAEQDRVLAPAAPARRRVVLATNVAETSLTIEGVRVVVDSGLERRAVFDPATGMSRLVTQRISRASADQRCGRAGRTAPGVCYRFWTESEHRRLAEHSPADILDADLAPLALELAIWGTGEPGALRW